MEHNAELIEKWSILRGAKASARSKKGWITRRAHDGSMRRINVDEVGGDKPIGAKFPEAHRHRRQVGTLPAGRKNRKVILDAAKHTPEENQAKADKLRTSPMRGTHEEAWAYERFAQLQRRSQRRSPKHKVSKADHGELIAKWSILRGAKASARSKKGWETRKRKGGFGDSPLGGKGGNKDFWDSDFIEAGSSKAMREAMFGTPAEQRMAAKEQKKKRALKVGDKKWLKKHLQNTPEFNKDKSAYLRRQGKTDEADRLDALVKLQIRTRKRKLKGKGFNFDAPGVQALAKAGPSCWTIDIDHDEILKMSKAKAKCKAKSKLGLKDLHDPSNKFDKADVFAQMKKRRKANA